MYTIIPDVAFQALEVQLRRRPLTFEGDLETVELTLEKTKKPPAKVLIEKLREMQLGTFASYPPNYKMLKEISENFDLDSKAMNALTTTTAKMKKDAAKEVILQLTSHLERSNKPSAMVIIKIVKLKNGEEIGYSTQNASVGSYLWDLEKAEKEKQDWDAKGKKTSNDDQRHSERERRDRSRGREYDRDRGSDRDRGDRDRGRRDDTGGRRDDREKRDNGRDTENDRDGGRNRDGDRQRSRSRDRGRRPDDRDRRDNERDNGRRGDRGSERDDRDRDNRGDRGRR